MWHIRSRATGWRAPGMGRRKAAACAGTEGGLSWHEPPATLPTRVQLEVMTVPTHISAAAGSAAHQRQTALKGDPRASRGASPSALARRHPAFRSCGNYTKNVKNLPQFSPVNTAAQKPGSGVGVNKMPAVHRGIGVLLDAYGTVHGARIDLPRDL